jgi:RNA polymerase-binding transcription factor DksA
MEESPAMQADKCAMRRLILSLLLDRLRGRYELELHDLTHGIDDPSMFELDGLLSFRSDSKLEELRGALTRLDNDKFGICIGCKNRIDWSLLLSDPARRICPGCEGELWKPSPEGSMAGNPGFGSTFFTEP